MKGKLTKVVVICTIISTIITLISGAFSFLVPAYIAYKLHIDASKANSIGIIGGADGPTAIFLTGQSSSYMITVIFALLSAAGFVYLILAKKAVK